MGRIIKDIVVDGKKIKALFDTGSERSYIAKHTLKDRSTCRKISGIKVGLGGKEHILRESCIVEPTIDDRKFDVKAHPVQEIGKVDEEEIDMLIGVTAMEEWDIHLDPKTQELDLRGLKKREFTEF